MSAEENKKLVLGFFEDMSAGNAEAFLGAMADNATWWVAGNPKDFPLAGTKTKAEFTKLLGGIGEVMPKGLKITPKGVTAEGNRVAVEAESYGEHASGKIYNNLYHFMVECENGKVTAVREYLDTMHANDVLAS